MDSFKAMDDLFYSIDECIEKSKEVIQYVVRKGDFGSVFEGYHIKSDSVSAILGENNLWVCDNDSKTVHIISFEHPTSIFLAKVSIRKIKDHNMSLENSELTAKISMVKDLVDKIL